MNRRETESLSPPSSLTVTPPATVGWRTAHRVTGTDATSRSETLVRHYCRNEWVRRLEDLMIRRTSWRHYRHDHADVAARAAQSVRAKLAIPHHFGTSPGITENANEFAASTWIVQEADRSAMFGTAAPRMAAPANYGKLRDAKTIVVANKDHDVKIKVDTK